MTRVLIWLIAAFVFAAIPIAALALFFRQEIKSIRLAKTPFQCQRDGRCCAAFNVTLTRADVERLAANGVNIKDVVIKRWGFNLLRKTPDGACVFLERDQDNGQARCAIYAGRPDICRRFPNVSFLGIKGKDCRCVALGGNPDKPKINRK